MRGNTPYIWRAALWAALVGLGVASSSCAGGGNGTDPAAGAATAVPIGIAAARAEVASNGAGNPAGSLSVVGVLSGRVLRTVAAGAGAVTTVPAANASVSTDRGAYSARTDANGNFRLTVPASIHNLAIALSGYRTLGVREVPALDGRSTDITTELTPLVPLDSQDTDRLDPSRPVQKSHVGTGKCRECHPAYFDAFTETRHSKPIRYVNDPVEKAKGFDVVADFTSTPQLSFPASGTITRALTVLLEKDSANRHWVTLVDAGTGTRHRYEARRTHGGTGQWKQRFQTLIGGSWYTLPVQWNEKENDPAKRWVAYNPGDWFDDAGNVRRRTASRAGQEVDVFGPAQGVSYERKCFGCHGIQQDIHRVTAAESVAGLGDVGDYVVDHTSLVVGCENCHGPGYPHVESQNPNDIVNPGKGAARTVKLTHQQRNEVCGQCHARGVSTHAGGYDYPWTADDRPYRLGNPLDGAFDVAGTGKYWNQKQTRATHSFQHHQQWLDDKQGAHSFAAAEVACVDCHDPHRNPAGRSAQLKLSADDNSLCLNCHGKDGRARIRFLLPGETGTDPNLSELAAHTKHATYDPAGLAGPVSGRCVACHMPRTAQSALRYDITDHTQRIVKPVEALDMLDAGGDKSAGLVLPHSCASPAAGCHASEGAPGGNFWVGTGEVGRNPAARAKLVDAVNKYEDLFGTRKAVGTDVAGLLGAVEGAVRLENVPIAGVRVSADRGEEYDETGADGTYRLLLPGGTYNLFAAHASFKTTSLEAVRVTRATTTVAIDFKLAALPPGSTAFIGSQKCRTCHALTYERWQRTLHNNGIRYVDADDTRDPRFRVVADFGAEGVGRTLTSADSDFGAAGLGAATIRLLRQGGVYTVTLVNGDGTTFATYTPERTYGGGRGDWKQRFLVRLGDSRHVLPVQWSEHGPVGPTLAPRWKAHELSSWLVPGASPAAFRVPSKARTYEYACTGCHATGLEAEYRAASQEVATKFVEMNIGCENCHGPGGKHARSGLKADILNPNTFATAQSRLDACGRCHSRGDSTIKANGTDTSEYGVANRTETFPGSGTFRLGLYSILDAVAGTPVFTGYFSNAIDVLDSRYWSSATWTTGPTTGSVSPAWVAQPLQRRNSIDHHQQANDFPTSRMFSVGLRCWSCHSPHGPRNRAGLLRPDGNLIVSGAINTQSLCLFCHGPNGPSPRRFTTVENLRTHFAGGAPSHRTAETAFACTLCHLVQAASTIEKWDLHSHTFQAWRAATATPTRPAMEWGPPGRTCSRTPVWAVTRSAPAT
ncbi:MAG: ammonia-forming cytochrome c nitrite reductase subunit c552 [Candidatus Riflebacteria bacterium]|nr:ammonia-forming cytochrome c nitrite reductase subunit c552 [Candidatus Riflebacteria bacterium]